MQFGERAKQLAEKNGVSIAKVEAILKDYHESLKVELETEGEVKILEVGTLRVIERAAREGRNPHTKETIQIPAKNAIKFVASKDAKTRVQTYVVPKKPEKQE